MTPLFHSRLGVLTVVKEISIPKDIVRLVLVVGGVNRALKCCSGSDRCHEIKKMAQVMEENILYTSKVLEPNWC